MIIKWPFKHCLPFAQSVQDILQIVVSYHESVVADIS